MVPDGFELQNVLGDALCVSVGLPLLDAQQKLVKSLKARSLV